MHENIPNIWHKSSAKHKRRSDQIKRSVAMQTRATSYPYLKDFTNGSNCFKEIFDQVRKDLDCELFYWTKTSRHPYIYYLATDNIHIVLENDNTVLKDKKVVSVKFSRNTHLMKRPMIGWNQEKSHFSNTGKILLKQEFSDGVTNIREHKECYYTFDNSLLILLEHSEHYTNLSR